MLWINHKIKIDLWQMTALCTAQMSLWYRRTPAMRSITSGPTTSSSSRNSEGSNKEEGLTNKMRKVSKLKTRTLPE